MKNFLIIIPTYNENNNVLDILKKINKCLKFKKDILFIDDNSDDGTLDKIKKNITKNIFLIKREKKLGVGSAHKLGIRFGFKKKYKQILTMDCDGTHHPKYVRSMIAASKKNDLVITSRFYKKNALSDCPFQRKIITYTRYILIKILFGISLDTSGAFRLYNVKSINLNDILLAKDNGYSFFWESIVILLKKKYRISEIPIILPTRRTGFSKMRIKDLFYALFYLFKIYFSK
jgi:dolichol-phosphate mannosyltransferase